MTWFLISVFRCCFLTLGGEHLCLGFGCRCLLVWLFGFWPCSWVCGICSVLLALLEPLGFAVYSVCFLFFFDFMIAL